MCPMAGTGVGVPIGCPSVIPLSTGPPDLSFGMEIVERTVSLPQRDNSTRNFNTKETKEPLPETNNGATSSYIARRTSTSASQPLAK